MDYLNSRAASVVLALSLSATSAWADNQEWRLTQETDEMDGSYSAVAEIGGNKPYASMSVKCVSSKVWLFVKLRDKEMMPTMRVTTKLDNDASKTTSRWFSQVLTGAGWSRIFMGGPKIDTERGRNSEGISDEMHLRRPIQFLQTMIGKKRLVVRAAVKNDPLPVTVAFNLEGAEEALKPILTHCIKPPPTNKRTKRFKRFTHGK